MSRPGELPPGDSRGDDLTDFFAFLDYVHGAELEPDTRARLLEVLHEPADSGLPDKILHLEQLADIEQMWAQWKRESWGKRGR